MIWTVLQVALGGAIGAVLRFFMGGMALRFLGAGFPYGTLGVNVVGAFLMGLCAVWISGARFSPFLMTGLLGGFTTFSAFSLDAVTLWERGETTSAAIYVIVSVLASILALIAGMALAKGLTA